MVVRLCVDTSVSVFAGWQLILATLFFSDTVFGSVLERITKNVPVLVEVTRHASYKLLLW